MRQNGARLLSERDLRLLRFVGEQTLVSLTQLAYMSGRSERTARWLRTRWERAGLAEARKFAVSQPTVLWATGAGLKQAGLPYHPVRPDGATAARALPAVEARWAVERHYPGARFVPYRDLSYRAPRGVPVPDGLIRVGGAEVAVVIEQNPDLNDWQLAERLRRRQGRPTLLLAAPALAARATGTTAAGGVTVVAWRWYRYYVRLPELPLLESVLPGTTGDDRFALTLGSVGAAPYPGEGAAPTDQQTTDEQWWVETEPATESWPAWLKPV